MRLSTFLGCLIFLWGAILCGVAVPSGVAVAVAVWAVPQTTHAIAKAFSVEKGTHSVENAFSRGKWAVAHVTHVTRSALLLLPHPV